MKYKNFSKGTLTAELSNVGTNLTITTTETFPTTGEFKVVIWSGSDAAPQEDSTREIMTLEWNSVESWYDIVLREEEGTTAKTWVINSFIAHVVTAEQYAGYENTLSLDQTTPQTIINGIPVFDLGLEIGNDNYISGKNYAGTDSINILKVNTDDEIDIGATMNIAGYIEGPADGGAITLFDMPVSSTPADGTEMSATLRVDGENILKIYAEADGTGGVKNLAVKPLTTLETVTGTATMAPIKMTAGTNLTTPVAGTIEFDGSEFYLSI
jgi:hypothetical protein